MTVYLGLDYGERHIGVALADGPLATPLLSLDMEPDRSLPHLAKLVSDHHIEEIILGLPEGRLEDKIRRFGEELSRLTGKPVIYHEETLLTKEAIRALREAGASKKKLMNDHIYAACVILEDYMETKE